MDIKKLMKALDDETNEKLFNHNSNILKETINQLHVIKTLDIYYKLIRYKYVEEVNDIKVGIFIGILLLLLKSNIYYI